MKRYSEKIVTLCCFLFMFANVGLVSTSFNVYQPYIVAVPGIGDIGGSVVLSVRTFTSLLAMVVVDRYFHALDMRRGVALACCMTTVGFVGYAVASAFASMALFVVSAAIAGCGYGFGGLVAVTILTNRWYKSDVGSAMGIATVGSGVASFVIPLVAVQVIHASSLSASFLLEAAISLAVGIVVLLFVRNRPSDVGMEPHSSSKGADRGGKAKPRAQDRPLSATAYRMLLLAMVFVGMSCVGGMSYLSVLFTSNGFDRMFAASLTSIAGLCLTVSKFATGKLFDRIGTERGSFVAFACMLVGLVLCCLAGTGSAPLALIAAVLLGTGVSIGSVGISVWSIDLSDAARRAKFIKNCQVGFSLGSFLMNLLPGPLKDLTGTYVVSYVLMTAFAFAAAVVVLVLYRRYRR